MTNVRQAVPFFWVRDMERSRHYYVEGLGFRITTEWVVEGKLQWCWLELGTAAIMLQELRREDPRSAPDAKLGVGVSIAFICADAIAIYHESLARGLDAGRPFVGNGMWVTQLRDPDGYELFFESPTDRPEESVL